jgi:hypothetical protein
MHQRVKQAFLSMGYRELQDTSGNPLWMKPIGYSVFVYRTDGRLYQYFKEANGQRCCMQSWEVREDDPLTCIKEAENYAHQPSTSLGSNFEFLTPEQSISLFISGDIILDKK